MRLISIHVSPHQLRKLKRGHKVRLIKGKGFNLIVNPENYKLASRAFTKNKGVQMKLSDEELVANQSAAREPEKMNQIAEDTQQNEGETVEMTGQGIFSKAKREVNPVGRGIKEVAKKMTGKGAHVSKGMSPHVSGLTKHISRKVAEANSESAGMSHKAISHRIQDEYPTYEELSQQPFAPFSRGYGIHHGGHNAIVGRGGGMIGHGHPGHGGFYPQALMPQPYSVNYQMAHFLPPHFQHFNNSVHRPSGHSEGSGLYAGRGFGLFT